MATRHLLTLLLAAGPLLPVAGYKSNGVLKTTVSDHRTDLCVRHTQVHNGSLGMVDALRGLKLQVRAARRSRPVRGRSYQRTRSSACAADVTARARWFVGVPRRAAQVAVPVGALGEGDDWVGIADDNVTFSGYMIELLDAVAAVLSFDYELTGFDSLAPFERYANLAGGGLVAY
jgi:hypothetical protein